MYDHHSFSRAMPRLAPIAVGIALMWGHCDRASAITVQNCNDHGNGSLRAAVNAASSGDTIDMTQLNCTITLTTGAIIIDKPKLTFAGPGADKLTIDGGATSGHYNRILVQNTFASDGLLKVTGVTLTDAKYKTSGGVAGGCVYSINAVEVFNSTVSSCVLVSTGNNYVKGAGISGGNGVEVLYSTVTGNIAKTSSAGVAEGGGIYCRGNLTVDYSTVSGNTATGNTATQANFGGGISQYNGNINLLGTTVSGNLATLYAGMSVSYTGSTSFQTQIFNSTISGNTATSGFAGAKINATSLIVNSTIAFNSSRGAENYGAGLKVVNHPVELESTIVAMNTSSIGLSDVDFISATAVSGANNLITQSEGPIPANTTAACPLLGRLGDNGGPTQTYRLLPNSPALDAGNNVEALMYDQRGNGHPRTVGTKTDIGAFEYAGGTADEIFSSEFENRCN